MSNSRLIEIVSAAGEGFVFGPAGVEGPGQILKQPSAEAWSAWLQQNFARKFAEQASHWEQVIATVNPWQSAQAPQSTFRRVAKLIDQSALQARRLPTPAPANTVAPAGAPAAAMRTLDSGNSNVAPAVSPQGAPASKGAAVEDIGQDAADMQCKGDPVAPVSGEEILTVDDFTVAAPMPLRWQRWYRSGYSDRDLGLGYGWYAQCLRLIWQDDDATWLLDGEARPVRLPLLEPGQIAWQARSGHRLERKIDNRMLLTEADGVVWIFKLDGQKRWRPVSVQNMLGHQWLFHYDSQRRLCRIDLSARKQLDLEYANERLSRISLKVGDQQQELAVYDYDARGDLVASSSQQGPERYRYLGHLLERRELPTGYGFTFEWEGQGPQARCLVSRGDQGHHEFRFDYEPDKCQTTVTDAFGNTQIFHYDDKGRITARQEPDGAVYQWQYDEPSGLLVAYRLPDGRTTRFGYDSRGRKLIEEYPDGRQHRWEYDALGFCVAQKKPDGRIIRRRFDSLGRLLYEQGPDGGWWRYKYGDKGWLTSATSESGDIRRFGVNDDGEVLASEQQDSLQRYAFDLQGRVAGHLEQDLVTRYDYAGAKLLAVYQYPEQAPDQRRSRQYQYDQSGRLITFTNATGQTHRYEYDQLARPTAYRRPDGHAVHYDYDLAERLTAVTRADGNRWQFGWNPRGLVDHCRAPDGRDIRLHYNAAGEITRREHLGLWVQTVERDAAGQVISQTSQGKGRAPVIRHYQYDEFGRRSHASCVDRKLRWEHDAQGRVTAHHQDNHRVGYTYTSDGKLETIQLPDGTHVRYHLDPYGSWNSLDINGHAAVRRNLDSQGRETLREAGSNTQSQIHDRHGCLIKRRWQGEDTAIRRYRWDDESRLEACIDSLSGEIEYERDAQGQLIRENDTHYQYDLGGNRIPINGVLENDRLLKHGNEKRVYDALGAETRVIGKTVENRRFDAEGQLIAVSKGELHAAYGYDALGRRAWRKTSESTVTYLWHNDVLLGEQRQGQWQWYIRDPRTDEPMLTLINGKPYYYELDWRMMPVRLWSADGEKVWQANADAWGRCDPEFPQGPVHQPIRLPGQFEDELTGLFQNRYREYEPCSGRYLTPDPLGVNGGLNSFSYTFNPVDFIDPLGLSSCSPNKLKPLAAAAMTIGLLVGSDAIPTAQSLPGHDTLQASQALANPNQQSDAQWFAESLWNNVTNLRLSADAGAAFGGFGANLSASREMDGDSPSIRGAWASGLGAFGGAFLEGMPISFGEMGNYTQSASFSIGAGIAAKFTVAWSDSGFQVTTGVGGGLGLKANIVDFGYSQDL